MIIEVEVKGIQIFLELPEKADLASYVTATLKTVAEAMREEISYIINVTDENNKIIKIRTPGKKMICKVCKGEFSHPYNSYEPLCPKCFARMELPEN